MEEHKYLDSDGLSFLISLIKTELSLKLDKASHTGKLTIGDLVFDGSADVTVPVYTGEVED